MKKNPRTNPDHVLQIGPYRIAKFGRFIQYSNLASPEEQAKLNEQFASEYESRSNTIRALILEIVDLLSRFDPFELMKRSHWEFYRSHIGIDSEPKIGENQLLSMRMLDYVQSLLASSPQTAPTEYHVGSEKYDQLRSKVRDLFNHFGPFFFISQSALRKKNGVAYPDDIETIFVQTQMYWITVRSNRYQYFDLSYLSRLLTPHSEQIEKLFGIDSDLVTEGLRKLQNSLSSGLGSSISAISEDHQQFLHWLTGDEATAIMESHLEHAEEDSDENSLSAAIRKAYLKRENNSLSVHWQGAIYGDQLYDVSQLTKWPSILVDELSWSIGEDSSFIGEYPDSGWPTRSWPIFARPFLRIRDKVYCFDYVALFDRFYRQIQRIILKLDPTYANEWNRKQNEVSESLPAELLQQILPNTRIYRNLLFKIGQKELEIDLLLVEDDVLLIGEVKAGAFTRFSPTTDFESYFKSIEQFIVKPSNQLNRVTDRLREKGKIEFYTREDSGAITINSADIDLIIPICFALDNITFLGARAHQMPSLHSGRGLSMPWTLSIDDFFAIADLFRNAPVKFFHFAAQRLKAMKNQDLDIADEMDHVGLYFLENLYCERYSENRNPIQLHGYGSIIDEYFYNKASGECLQKPGQKIPLSLDAILRCLQTSRTKGYRAAAFRLLDLGSRGRDLVARTVRESWKRARTTGDEVHAVVSHSVSPISIVSSGAGVRPSPILMQQEVMASVLRQAAADRLFLRLKWDNSADIVGVEFKIFIKAAIECCNRVEVSVGCAK